MNGLRVIDSHLIANGIIGDSGDALADLLACNNVRSEFAADSDSRRTAIAKLESMMCEQPQIDLQLRHTFGGGVYTREVFIPRGTLLIGKRHRTEHINIVIQGDIVIATEDGLFRVKAPYTLVSKPGTKRVGYAVEDTIWMTVHPTTETDLQKIEMALIEPEEGEIQCLS